MLKALCVIVMLLAASSAFPLTTADVGESVNLGLRPTINVTAGYHEFPERARSQRPPVPQSLLVSTHDEYKTSDILSPQPGSSLLQRDMYDNYTEYTVNVTRILRTPWPLVGAQFSLSQFLLYFGSIKDRAAPPSLPKRIIWVFNFVRGAVATVYQALDIAEQKGVVPSVGVANNFLTLLASSYAFFDHGFVGRLFSYGGVFICIIGLIVYLTNGILGLVSSGPGVMSVELIIPVGCPGGYRNDEYGVCSTIEYMQLVYEKTIGDWLYEIGWALGAVFIFLIVLVPFFYNCTCKFKLDFSDEIRETILWATFWVNSVGGALAFVGGGLATEQYSADFIDCSQASRYSDYFIRCVSTSISLPGDVTGFWNIWAEDKAAVVRSVFTW